MTVEAAGEALRARRVSVRELTRDALNQIERWNARINALITVTGEAALARADVLDREIAAGHFRGPLHGVPVVHKDCLYTAGVRTTGGSRIFSVRCEEVERATPRSSSPSTGPSGVSRPRLQASPIRSPSTCCLRAG